MKANILWLEDLHLDQEWIQNLLELEGYQVHHAANGGQALKIIQDDSIPLSLAIIDVNIEGSEDLEEAHLGEPDPKRRGVIAAKRLLEKRGEIPIIFVSAYGEEAKKIIKEAGFDGPSTFFNKISISSSPEGDFLQTISEAIEEKEKYVAQKKEKQGKHELLFHTVVKMILPNEEDEKLKFIFKIDNRDLQQKELEIKSAFSFKIVYWDEISYIWRNDKGSTSSFFVQLNTGDSLQLSSSLNRISDFEHLYENWVDCGMMDFLIQGTAERGGHRTTWVNWKNVVRYGKGMAYFKGDEEHNLAINQAIKDEIERKINEQIGDQLFLKKI